MTEPRTCRREAPSVRSVASSRVRWATVMEIVLKITNAPTNSAMAPNASRMYLTRLVPAVIWAASWLACWLPVRTCATGGRRGLISAARRDSETPGLAATEMPS